MRCVSALTLRPSLPCGAGASMHCVICLRCGRRSFGAPACLVRSDSPRLLRNWRGSHPVVTDWHCAPAFLAGCGTRSARHAAPPFRDGRMKAPRNALVRSDRAVLRRAAWGVAKAARPMSMDGGCQPRRATDEERARSRVERARPRGRNPRERKDEHNIRAGSARFRRASAQPEPEVTGGRARSATRTQSRKSPSFTSLRSHFWGSRLQNVHRAARALSRAGGRRLRRGSARRWQRCLARVSDRP